MRNNGSKIIGYKESYILIVDFARSCGVYWLRLIAFLKVALICMRLHP